MDVTSSAAPVAPGEHRSQGLSLGLRKDLKWTLAMMSVALFSLSAFSLIIYTVSDRKAAVPLLGGLLTRASETSLGPIPHKAKGDLRDPLMAEIRKQTDALVKGAGTADASKAPGNTRIELPGLGVAIPLDARMLSEVGDGDLVSIAARAAAANLFAESEKGLPLSAEAAGDLGIGVSISAISMQGHAAALGLLSVAAVPAFVLGFLAALLSSRSGRLLTPGLILLSSAAPAALLYSLLGSLGAAATLASSDLVVVGVKAALLSAAAILYIPVGLGVMLICVGLMWGGINIMSRAQDRPPAEGASQ